MIKLKSANIIKKILGIFLSVLIIALSVAPMGLAAVTYPQGVSEQQAQDAMKQTDEVLKALARNTENRELSQVVLSLVFSDETLSALATTMYSMIEENSQTFSTIGLDFSPAAISSCLGNYPQVQSQLSYASSWSEVNLSDAQWGIETVADFQNAAAALFTPMNDLLYTILCAGSYDVNPLVGLKGAKGYETSIVRIFIKCGMESYTDAQTFTSQAAADKSSMVRNLISDLASYLEKICSAPATMISTKLPGIAYFIHTGGLDDAISRLIEPLRLKVLGITTPIKVGSIMDVAVAGQEGMSFNFELELNSFSTSGTLKTAPFDLAALASLAVDDIDTYIVNTSDSFIYILRWLIETVKLNASQLPAMLSDMNGSAVDSQQLQSTLNSLFSKSTDELMSIYINLLSQTSGKINPYVWSFAPMTPVQISYTENLGQEKYQRVLDGIDELINQFVKEGGEAETLRKSLQPQIYSNKLITELAVSIYSALTQGEMAGISSLIGVDMSPSGLAKSLSEDSYSSAREVLNSAKSFTELKQKQINWGFKDGNKTGFGKAAAAIFRPLDSVLRMLLCAEKADLLGAISFYGSDGYNSAVIPLLEAIGCSFDKISTYEQFCNETKNTDIMLPIVNSLLSLVERMLDYPVYTLTGILPNLMYFINGNGIEACISNLLYPITSTLDSLGLSDMLDTSTLTKIDTDKLLDELLSGAELGIKLPELDLKQFASIGTLTTAQTKRTQAGQETTIQYVQSDRTGVLITLLRYLVTVLKTPGNESILDSFMNSSGEQNEMFATYSAGIGDELAKMTTDETVEWLYKIFFRERATVEQVDPDYAPTIIYNEKKSVNITAILACVLIFIIVVIILAMLNRDKLTEIINQLKEKKAQKEES